MKIAGSGNSSERGIAIFLIGRKCTRHLFDACRRKYSDLAEIDQRCTARPPKTRLPAISDVMARIREQRIVAEAGALAPIA